jgi:hypothetical protein
MDYSLIDSLQEKGFEKGNCSKSYNETPNSQPGSFLQI